MSNDLDGVYEKNNKMAMDITAKLFGLAIISVHQR